MLRPADVFLRESEAPAADAFCAKAQCQRSVSNRVLSARKRSVSGNNNTTLVTQALSQDVKPLSLSSSISAGVWTPTEK
ncbi:hypothetical protein [Lysinibacillus xylanilyticus]|uniref:hypothetical protein n=1 Tax=Lysinibacillus xylanilyticus TaxID=582475 RepID=UPI003D01F45B